MIINKMKKFFLFFVFFQIPFAMDSSVEKVLRCLEKKQLSVLSVDKIDRKIYVKGEKIDEKKIVNRIVLPSSRDVPFLEYKGGCSFQEKYYLEDIIDVQRIGVLGAGLNDRQDSIIVLKKDSVLWSCSQRIESNLIDIQILDQSTVMFIPVFFDSLWLLNDKCQWTLFESKVQKTFYHNVGANSRFVPYCLGKQRTPYTVVFDSLRNKHWGTSLSFRINASTRNVACGYDFSEDPDDTGQNRWLVKCVKWTGSNFVEFILPHKVHVWSQNHSVAERLFPCGDGICSQNFETKKIKILIDE